MELHNIQYRVSYRDIKYPRLEFTTGELLFVLPYGNKPETLLNKHRGWILKKMDFIKECMKDIAGKQMSFRAHGEFKGLIHESAEKTAEELGVRVNDIYFREMRTKWASLSPRGNLTVNMWMRYLPAHLIKYVIFHETAHLIEKRHNERFLKIISSKFSNYRELEREMFVYWFVINKKICLRKRNG